MDLRDFFDSLTDSELLRRVDANSLTEEALTLALTELANRGLADPRESDVESDSEPTESVELITLESGLSGDEAQSLACSLQSAGIPYVYGDIRRAQDGRRAVVASVTILVHPSLLADAQEAFAAYRRGDLAIDETYDPNVDA